MTSQEQNMKNEILKCLTVAALASATQKKPGTRGNMRYYSKDTLNLIKERKHYKQGYEIKCIELERAIELINKCNNQTIASYNLIEIKDLNGVNTWNLIFDVVHNNNHIQFKFHIPKRNMWLKEKACYAYPNIKIQNTNNYRSIAYGIKNTKNQRKLETWECYA